MNAQTVALIGLSLALFGWLVLVPFSEFRHTAAGAFSRLAAFWDGWRRFFERLTLNDATKPRTGRFGRFSGYPPSLFISKAFSGDFTINGGGRHA